MPIFFIVFAVLLALPVLWPQVDLLASGLFYSKEQGFFLADKTCLNAIHWFAFDGARALGAAFALGAIVAWYRRKAGFVLDAKAWLFLLLALVIGPGLVANVGLKDHWGRSRPREVVEFGGEESFSPALVPQFQKARSNGSFVSGDTSFGFFLPAFAYIVPRRFSRRVFWGSMGAGLAFAFSRLAMGAHFLSDNLYAAFFMLVSTASVHAAMYGGQKTKARWQRWFNRSSDV